MYKNFKFNSFKEKKGTLIPISFSDILGFSVKRIFFISGNTKFSRGNHAHKKCVQSFIQMLGSSRFELQNKRKKKIISLNSKQKRGITVSPKTWVKINFKSKKNLILVLCSHDYNKKDYIYDIKKL